MKKQKGFSLIELMIVVGIIALLATLALPRFQAFQWKARQSEARNTLNHIYTLEEAYKAEKATYTVMQNTASSAITVGPGGDDCSDAVLGFKLDNCANAYYNYWVPTATATAFTAQALEHNNKVCGKSNQFSINNDHNLVEDTPCQ